MAEIGRLAFRWSVELFLLFFASSCSPERFKGIMELSKRGTWFGNENPPPKVCCIRYLAAKKRYIDWMGWIFHFSSDITGMSFGIEFQL